MTDPSEPNTRAQRLLETIRGAKASPQEDLTQQKIKERETDRALKEMYAKRWFWVVFGQLLVVNAIFIVGHIRCQYDDMTVRVFLTAILAEVFGIVLVITKSLFPRH